MEVVKGIVLRAIDYKEADKLITLFCLGKGKISVLLKSARGGKAKQKFAFQPFCFAEYSLTEKNSMYISTSIELIDSFFEITSDYDTYKTGAKLLETTLYATDSEPNDFLFMALIQSLKALSYDKIPHKKVLAKYLCELFKSTGYNFNLQKCQICGLEFKLKVFIDYNVYSFVCSACKNANSYEISFAVFNSLRLLHQTAFEKLHILKIKEEILDEIIVLLLKNYNDKF